MAIQRRRPEVMSPAGYWPQLRAAVEAGADAVYFGLHHFTARAKVGFSLAELPEVMRTLRARGVRGYITFNTLIFEHEIEEARRALVALAEAGVDALILQDLGIARLARRLLPEMELHASTQMSITDAAGVRFALSLGLNRVTLARELSLADIRRILAETDADLEIFVHGALCVAYSGQCFSSEAWGGRSANRGQCAQACRLPYELLVDGALKPLGDARYLLSPGDLFALHQIPEIIETGVACLKIEGRYKDADYVALTTAAYRRAVDEAWARQPLSQSPLDDLRLAQVYSRGLGPHFLSGTNHQAVVDGRAPRHRGVLLGRVASLLRDAVLVEPSEAHSLAPLKPGDGLVFDAADWRSPEEPEEGGRLYEILPALDGRLELRFANNALRFDRIRPGDLLWRSHDPELDRAAKPFLEPPAPLTRQLVNVHAVARPGEPLKTTWTLDRRPHLQVTVESAQPLQPAQKNALDLDLLRAQLSRLGQTVYELGGLTLDSSEPLFAPSSLLNALRRQAIEQLAALQAQPPAPAVAQACCQTPPVRMPTHGAPSLHLLVRTPDQLEAALEFRPASITLDYLDLYGLRPSVDRIRAAGLTPRVAAPRILKPDEHRIPAFLASLGCALLVRSTGLLEALRAHENLTLIGDFSLNTANSATACLLLSQGLHRLTPTHDLNAAQVADLARRTGGEALEAVVYQHLPVFHTEHCVFCRFLSNGTTHLDCGRPCEKHRVALRDDNGRAHPVLADVGCRNTVFGAEAQHASAHLASWLESGLRHFRLEFAHESPRDILAVAAAFDAALLGQMSGRELAECLRRIAPAGVTEGSLFVPPGFARLPVVD